MTKTIPLKNKTQCQAKIKKPMKKNKALEMAIRALQYFLGEMVMETELSTTKEYIQLPEATTLSSSGLVLASAGKARREYRCRFVKAGRVKGAGDKLTDIEITAGALEMAVVTGKLENRAVFIDHAGFFDNPSLRDLAGVTYGVTWNALEESVEGTIRLYSNAAPIADILDELLQDTEKPDIGLSMVFWPLWAPRDNADDPRRITEVRYVESVDLVFQPAADGRILEALSICRNSGGNLEMAETIVTPAPEAGTTPQPAQPAEASAVSDWMNALSQSVASAMIGNSGLPAASKERLSGLSFNAPEDVILAVEAERSYLAKLAENQVINIGGQAPRGGHIQVGLNELDKISLAMEALFCGTRPEKDVAPLSGIREGYILLSGDYEMTGLFHGERVQFANVTSSTMASITANILNKRVVNLYNEFPRWWEPIVTQEDFGSLQTVRWITLGGVGELPTVAEGATYTELTWDDSYNTASFTKKGGYLGITLEAIDKDDTRKVQAAPRALAQAAWLTLGKSVSAIFTSASGTGPTLADTGVLFNSTAVTTAGGHANLGTTALSYTTWNAARLAMRSQTELNSGERLGALTAPKYLLVPPDLEITALQMMGSESDYLYTLSNGPAAPVNVHTEGNSLQARMAHARNRVIVVDLWTDTNDWAAVCDPNLWPTIGVAYRYGRTPEIFSVASPTAGLMFTNDTLPVKVRFLYATGPMDYRGLYKANVS